MASFTDNNIPQFNPYVQQLPVEAMVEVGTAKQKMYNEGVTAIQSEVDKLGGLDIARPVDRAYLQSKINQLGNNLKYFVASDFSDFQLVNSVTGMVKAIEGDKSVRNAVASTAKYRKEVGMMEKDREAGKLSPDNELFFSKQANSWLNDSDVNNSFNGKYIPFYDVFDHLKKAFEPLKADGYSFDQIYQLGADGNPILDKRGNLILSPHMTRMEKEGMFPEKVKQVIEQAFSDPRVNQQLQITGEYNYRNYSPEQLIATKIEPQRIDSIKNYQNAIDELKTKIAIGKGSPEINDMISKLEADMNMVNESYSELKQMAISNPDSIAGMIYKNEAKGRYTKMFGWEKTKTQILDNPAWRAQFDMQKEANEQSRFAQRLAFDMKRAEKDDLKWQLKYEQEERLALLKEKGKNGSLFDPSAGIPTVENPIDVIIFNENEVEDARNEYLNTSNELVWKLLYENGDPKTVQKNIQKLEKELTRTINGVPITRQQAISNLIKEAAKSRGENINEYMTAATQRAIIRWNSLTPEQQASSQITNDNINSFVKASKVWKMEEATQKRISEFSGKLGFEDVDFEPTIVKGADGKDYELTKQDATDLALYIKSLDIGVFQKFWGSDETKYIIQEGTAAKKRLDARGMSNISSLVEDLVKYSYHTKKDKSKNRTKALPDPIGGMPFEANSYNQLLKVFDIYDNLDKDFSKVLKRKAEAIKAIKSTNQNIMLPITTGDAEIDRGTLAKVKSITGAYASSEQNLSPSFDDFRKVLYDSKKMEDVTINVGVTKDKDGNPSPSVIIFKGKDKFEMSITNEELNTLNYDMNQLYESKEVRQIRNLMKANSGRTSSSANYKDPSIYIDGDYLFNNNDLPMMSSSKNHSAKVNIVESGGLYYPVIYASNGVDRAVKELPGDPNLEATIIKIKNLVSPQYIDLLLK